MLGSCPRDQAGKATEAKCDFRWRGGTSMISRRIRPSRTAASPHARPLRAVPGIAGHDPYMLVHREAGQRTSDFPKVTPSRPGEARRRLLLQEGSLRRKARITLLNFSGLCSGAKWLTPGSRMNSAPEASSSAIACLKSGVLKPSVNQQ